MKSRLNKSKSLSGQSLPEVLTSMLLLGILMLIAYPSLQRGMGLSSALQQQLQLELIEQMLMEPLSLERLEREIQGRRLVREVVWLSETEQILYVQVSCFLGKKEIRKRHFIMQAPSLIP